MVHRNVWIGIPIALIAIIAVLSCLHGVARQRADAEPHGRLTSGDITARIKAVSRISVLPDCVNQSARKLEAYGTNGRSGRFWNMDCSDKNGNFVGFVRWNADSGDLSVLSRNASLSTVSAPDLTRAEAISRTLLLLRWPGIGIPSGPWRLAGPPTLSETQQKVERRLMGRRCPSQPLSDHVLKDVPVTRLSGRAADPLQRAGDDLTLSIWEAFAEHPHRGPRSSRANPQLMHVFAILIGMENRENESIADGGES